MLIGLGHKARRGKGTVAKKLVDTYGFTEVNFSDALYKECRDLHGMIGKDGSLLQDWGVFRRNHYGEDYWVKQVSNLISNQSKECNFVISDCRFPDEVDFVRRAGGVLWRVDRVEPLEDIGRDPNHISETALDDYICWDDYIKNEGDLNLLNFSVDRCLAYLQRQIERDNGN